MVKVLENPIILSGIVVHVKGKGHTVGMPTANLSLSGFSKVPEFGVYASVVRLPFGFFMGLTNVGLRPSVDDDDRVSIETTILDFDMDIYGVGMILELTGWIRDTKKFSSLEEVHERVKEDEKEVRKFFALP